MAVDTTTQTSNKSGGVTYAISQAYGEVGLTALSSTAGYRGAGGGYIQDTLDY